ncbi:MAG TPA: nucleotide exchange factor GrpE [Blastocatellia bacterium]|nr:nucleotide exchange factor GrpE [Blastocatellia bacterium]
MTKKKDDHRAIPIKFEDDSEEVAEGKEVKDERPAEDAETESEPEGEVKAEEAKAETDLGGSDLQSQVDALTQEKALLYDQLLRRQAEFENYRRRMEREKSELAGRARADVVLELLPVYDNFERALSSLEKSSADAQALRQGVELIHKQLKDALTKLGLQPIESVGQTFDPHLHEAVTIEPTDEHEENTVIEEFQRGYKLGDRLLRPSQVKVARSPERQA